MRVILRFLTILFEGIADAISDFNRGWQEYDEFCKGMRTMSLRQKVKQLEAGNAQTELAIASLRTSLEQLTCEHCPVASGTEWIDVYGTIHHCDRQLKCSKCGKILVNELGLKEYLEFKAKESGEKAIAFQEALEQLLADKTGDE